MFSNLLAFQNFTFDIKLPINNLLIKVKEIAEQTIIELWNYQGLLNCVYPIQYVVREISNKYLKLNCLLFTLSVKN